MSANRGRTTRLSIDTIEGTEAELRRVGFSGGFCTGAELLEWYRNELEDRLRESIDDVDDADARSTPEAMAAEQAVKAAQQVYEGVVKEARAKIRKHRMSRMR